MSTVETLLAKAMSTTSEEEAISCLRMARKRGGTVGSAQQTVNEDAEYWKNKATHYYNLAKNLRVSLDVSQRASDLWRANCEDSERRRKQILTSKHELEHRLFVHKLWIVLFIMLTVSSFAALVRAV